MMGACRKHESKLLAIRSWGKYIRVIADPTQVERKPICAGLRSANSGMVYIQAFFIDNIAGPLI